MQQVAAELQLDIADPDGTTKALIVRVFGPVQSGSDWHCEVQYSGYRSRSIRIGGIDSWQALTLALHVAKAELTALLPRLRYLGKPVEMKSLFSGLSTAQSDSPGSADRPETDN